MKKISLLLLLTTFMVGTSYAGGSIFGGSKRRSSNPDGVSSVGMKICNSLNCPDVIIKQGDCGDIEHAIQQYGVCVCEEGYQALNGVCVPTGGNSGTSDPLCKDVKCESGQECVGGACVTVTPNSSNGCSNNSDCNTWCETNGYDKCYCAISSDPNWNDSNCYTSFTGTCAEVKTQSGISGGYVASNEDMTWWSAVNFCKAAKTGGKLVSLSDLGITGGYEDEAYCVGSNCTGANWSDLKSKLGYNYYWVTDASSCTDPENYEGCTSGSNNNSCSAFYVDSDNSFVLNLYRYDYAYALCE